MKRNAGLKPATVPSKMPVELGVRLPESAKLAEPLPRSANPAMAVVELDGVATIEPFATAGCGAPEPPFVT